MGIWDAVYSSADAVYQRLPDPKPVKSACASVCGAIGSAIGSARDAAPGLVVGTARWSYDRGLAAACAVDRAVRVEGAKRFIGSVPDKEILEKVGGIALDLTDLAVDAYSRPYTGGLPAYRLVKNRLLKNEKKSMDHDKLQELLNRVERLERATQGRVECLEHVTQGRHCPQHIAGMYQKPEDVIRVFMMKGFVGGDFIHDQIVNQHRNWKKDVLLTPAINPFDDI